MPCFSLRAYNLRTVLRGADVDVPDGCWNSLGHVVNRLGKKVINMTTVATGPLKLTKRVVDGFSCPDGKSQAFLWCEITRGLGVRAMPDKLVNGVVRRGTKAFVFQGRVKHSGKEIRTTLGRCDEMTPDQARTEAETLRESVRKGVDPVEAQRAAARKVQEDDERAKLQGITLRQVMEHYVEKKKTKRGALKPKSIADIRRHVEKSFAAWADRPIQEITRDACEERFDHLSKFGLEGKRAAPVQAVQAFTILRALLNWAQEKHRVGGRPIIEENPVGVLKNMLHPPKARTGRVPLDKIGAVWNMLQAWGQDSSKESYDHTGADYVAFLMLTGARIGEASALTWDRVELGEDSGSWHLPNPKNSNPVTLPLSAPARTLLARRKRVEGNPYVFPARLKEPKHITPDARAMMERVSAIAGLHLSCHDLRRTFLAVAIKCGIELWKFELLTNHINQHSVTLGSYVERNDLRYLAPEAEAIGAWVDEAGRMASSRNVVALRA